MNSAEFTPFEDSQISYGITIKTINKIFRDHIKHCHQEIDTRLATHLEDFRDEFISLFSHAYKDVEYSEKA